METQTLPKERELEYWTINFDGSLQLQGAGAGILVTSPKGESVKYILQMHLPASNTAAEYEALLYGLRLRNVDHFLQLAVEECQFHIHVMDRPPLACRVGQQESHRLEPCYQCENLIEVHTQLLHISLRHKPRLVLADVADGVPLRLEDPLEADRADAGRCFLPLPCPVHLYRRQLIGHRWAPALVRLCLLE
jgi:hypothetical protein